MAVVNIREVYPGVSLGLWQMDETVEQLFGQYPHLQAYRSQLEEKYKNDGRKLEFLAIRALMYEMLKTNGASKGLLSHAGDITHNEAGKPLFRGTHSPLVLASTFFVLGRPSFLSWAVPSPFFRFLPIASTPLQRYF